MSFFDRLFRKQVSRQNEPSTDGSSSSPIKSRTYRLSDDDFEVTIRTNRELSEEQQSIIFATVKTELYQNNELPSKVCISIMLSLEIMEHMILNRISKSSAELIF